jgi:hypothetical protein
MGLSPNHDIPREQALNVHVWKSSDEPPEILYHLSLADGVEIFVSIGPHGM